MREEMNRTQHRRHHLHNASCSWWQFQNTASKNKSVVVRVQLDGSVVSFCFSPDQNAVLLFFCRGGKESGNKGEQWQRFHSADWEWVQIGQRSHRKETNKCVYQAFSPKVQHWAPPGCSLTTDVLTHTHSLFSAAGRPRSTLPWEGQMTGSKVETWRGKASTRASNSPRTHTHTHPHTQIY